MFVTVQSKFQKSIMVALSVKNSKFFVIEVYFELEYVNFDTFLSSSVTKLTTICLTRRFLWLYHFTFGTFIKTEAANCLNY